MFTIINRIVKMKPILLLCFVCVILPCAGRAMAQTKLGDLKPIILSYYWPMAHKETDARRWVMDTPNVIDVLKRDAYGAAEVRQFWQDRGKLILNRVLPFRQQTTEEEMYRDFSENMKDADGISIDEIADEHLDAGKSRIIINVLGRLRKAYPDKVIAVWGSRKWDRHVPVLEAIRDHADLFVPEIYISTRIAKDKDWLLLFNSSFRDLEKRAPGILKKTLAGIGLHQAMRKEPGVDFEKHLLAQIEHLGKDPFLRQLPGIALYAPIYLTPGEQKALDEGLRKHFVKEP